MKYEILTDDYSKTQIIKATDENGQEFFIPMDEGNSDYQAYMATLVFNSDQSKTDDAE